MNSTVFSLLASTICLYVLIIDKAISSSPLFYDSYLVKTNIAFVMGYAISDMLIILFNYKVIGDAFTIVHHCISLYGYSNALAFSVMPYFANYRLIVELSTPLVNMRWFLYACGYQKDSLHFFINGIAMTLVFFTVRVASIPVYWYKVYSVIDSPLWVKMRSLRYMMVVTCILLDIINIYWFRKMFNGAKIVWNTNWRYYSKHHKAQQLEMLYSYKNSIKDRLNISNYAVYQFSIDLVQRYWDYLPSLTNYYDMIYTTVNQPFQHHPSHDRRESKID